MVRRGEDRAVAVRTASSGPLLRSLRLQSACRRQMGKRRGCWEYLRERRSRLLEENSVNGKCLMPNARSSREFDIRHLTFGIQAAFFSSL